jgi:hypothetical protein
VEREIGRDRVHEVPSHPRRRLRGFSEMKYCNDASGVLYLFRRGRICQYQSLCIYIDVRHSLSKHRLRSMVCVRTLYQQLHVEGPNHTQEWDDCSYNSRLSIIRIPETELESTRVVFALGAEKDTELFSLVRVLSELRAPEHSPFASLRGGSVRVLVATVFARTWFFHLAVAARIW